MPSKKEAKQEIENLLVNNNLTPSQILDDVYYSELVRMIFKNYNRKAQIKFLENKKGYLKRKLLPEATRISKKKERRQKSILQSKDKILSAVEILKEEIQNNDQSVNKYTINAIQSPVDARNDEFYNILEETQQQVQNCLKHSSLYHSCDVKYFDLEDKDGNLRKIGYFVDKITKEIVAPFTNADAIGLNIQNLSIEANNILKKNKETGELDLDLEKLKELNKKINEYTKTYKLLKSVDNTHLYRVKNIQEMIVDQQKALFISSQNDKLRDELGEREKERKENDKKRIKEINGNENEVDGIIDMSKLGF